MTFGISSEHLLLAKPLLEKYYDYDKNMFEDEIQNCISSKGLNFLFQNSVYENNILHTNYREIFENHKDLMLGANTYSKGEVEEKFSAYFTMQSNDDEEETISEDDLVYICLRYMSCVYYKENEGLFDRSVIVEAFDLEYQFFSKIKILHNIVCI